MSARKKKRVPRESVRDQLSGAWECLNMVREELELAGLPMQGTPPMFYDDAIRALASILGRAAGLEKWIDVQRHVAEHEAARVDAEIAQRAAVRARARRVLWGRRERPTWSSSSECVA